MDINGSYRGGSRSQIFQISVLWQITSGKISFENILLPDDASGGVCRGCVDNTTGVNCERCKEGYFRGLR